MQTNAPGPQTSELPPGQRSYLEKVRDYVEQTRLPPSYNDLAKMHGASLRAARNAIKALIAKGMIERGPGRYRCWLITPLGQYELSRKPASTETQTNIAAD